MLGHRLGAFEITDELGRGGMGAVYRAKQDSPQRLVALKVLPPELAHSPGTAARFREEANRMAQLDGHPHIATVYAAGEDNGTAYFAMQLLTGGDLEQRLQREGRLDQREAAEIVSKVADALDHAHQRGIIHRDIKPANIMFSAQGEPVVTDFGIAKAADEMRMTLTGMSVCTPQYASPEQVKGNPIDGRSDLYSLGVVLYHMVCGRPLFDCSSPMSWAAKHMTEVPVPPASWNPGLNRQLQTVILKCLAKEPSERFSTAGDLARALRSIDWLTPAIPQGNEPNETAVIRPMDATVSHRRAPVWPYAVAAVGIIALALGAYLAGQAGRDDSGIKLPVEPPGTSRAEATEPSQAEPPESPIRDAGLAIENAYAELGRLTRAHQESNRPWKDYGAIHGHNTKSWHDFLTANAETLIGSDQELREQWLALAGTLEQIAVPGGSPASFELMRQKMLYGVEAASERMRFSEQLMRQELNGADPSWGKQTPYGQARSRMIEYIGDGGQVGGSAGPYYQTRFRPDLEQLH